MSAPKFSIITIVYNGVGLLPGTMESIRQQTYSSIEYIIIDGASKDGSVDLIRAFAAEMPGQVRWISEPDKGLYDAMNKGLNMATGDFVWFMNCGDHLHAPNTVELVAQQVTEDTDVLYGETLLVDEDRKVAGTMSTLSTRKLPVHLHWRDYLGGMLVVHQSFVARRTLAPAYISDNLCADFDWCIRILKQSRKNVHTGQILSDYLMGGLSKKKHQLALRQRFEVMRTHFGLIPTLFAHFLIILRAFWHKLWRFNRPTY